MEANVSFPKAIGDADSGGVTLAVVYEFLPNALTFLYTFGNCAETSQAIRVVEPKNAKDLKE